MKTISHPRPWKMKAPQVNWQEDSSQTNSVPQPKFRVTHPPMPPNAQDGSKVVMQAIVKWFEDQDQIKLLKMASRGQIRTDAQTLISCPPTADASLMLIRGLNDNNTLIGVQAPGTIHRTPTERPSNKHQECLQIHNTRKLPGMCKEAR